MSNESFNGTVAMALIVVKAMIEICPKSITAYRETDIQILETIRDDFGPDQEIHITRKEGGNVVFKIVTDDEHLTAINQLKAHLRSMQVAVELLQESGSLVAEVTRPAEKQETKQPKQENQKMNEEKKHSWKEDMKAEAQQKTAEKKAEAQAAPQQPSMAVRVAVATVKVATVAGLAYGAFRLYKHFTSKSETTEV